MEWLGSQQDEQHELSKTELIYIYLCHVHEKQDCNHGNCVIGQVGHTSINLYCNPTNPWVNIQDIQDNKMYMYSHIDTEYHCILLISIWIIFLSTCSTDRKDEKKNKTDNAPGFRIHVRRGMQDY